jgi:hypothetical protein
MMVELLCTFCMRGYSDNDKTSYLKGAAAEGVLVSAAGAELHHHKCHYSRQHHPGVQQQ